MFLSTIKVKKEVEAVHLDFIINNLTPQGFTVLKQKSKDLESGLNVCSFTLEKNGLYMSTFIFHINKNEFIVAGYHHGKLVKEKMCKYESDLPSLLIELFNFIKKGPEDEPIRFDIQLQILQKTCENIEKKQKNLNNFTQEVKTTQEYQHLKQLERSAYQKIISDTEKLIQDKQKIKKLNENIVDPLLRVQSCKQSLQTAIMAFEQQNAYMSNAKQRIKQTLETLRSTTVELTPSKLNEQTFNDYLTHLTKTKELELKQKYLVS